MLPLCVEDLKTHKRTDSKWEATNQAQNCSFICYDFFLFICSAGRMALEASKHTTLRQGEAEDPDSAGQADQAC